ncbi:MAG TPA: TlpA disulfide reductase family protein [Chitinophagaceae bacterium]|nr:TlpA disulfide reductase family protein [Chitinophagaceae bacterium]
MKKVLLFIRCAVCAVGILLLAPLFVAAQTTKGFTIEGKLDGFPDGTKIALYKNGTQAEWKSTTLQKGKFSFKEKVDEPTLCFITIEGIPNAVELYVENAIITVKGNKSNAGKYDIQGSKAHKDFSDFVTVFLPVAKNINALAGTINASQPGASRDSFMQIYTATQQELQKHIDKFVRDKPGSYVTAFILNVTYQFNNDVVMLENRFNQLQDKIKNSATGKQLEAFITKSKIGAVGTMAMDFTQPDTTGTPVSLSSFRGKYVLVDFWASWCGPCRSENPNVVENYHYFKNRNFTVLGVSLDRPGYKDRWLDAIKTDNLAWTHVSDLQWWDNAAAKLYHIEGIPQNFLIDPNGKIVARNLRGPELRSKLCEILGGCN